MARHIKAQKADQIEIGEITLYVTRSRAGQLCLMITAPMQVKIRHFKGSQGPDQVPEQPMDTTFGVLPSQIIL